MHALKISVNDRPPIVAGANDLGVLVLCVGAHDGNARRLALGWEPTPVYDLHIGGRTARAAGAPNEHLAWGGDNLVHSGDVVTVEIIDTEEADPPSSATPASTREKERALFEHCKRTYLALRDKYESARAVTPDA